MKYQQTGDKIELISHIVKCKSKSNLEMEEIDGELQSVEIENEYEETFYILNDEQLEEIEKELKEQEIEYNVEKVDNSKIEWLQHKEFTNDERRSGLLEKAIELGESAYSDFLISQDDNAQRDILLSMLLAKVMGV